MRSGHVGHSPGTVTVSTGSLNNVTSLSQTHLALTDTAVRSSYRGMVVLKGPPSSEYSIMEPAGQPTVGASNKPPLGIPPKTSQVDSVTFNSKSEAKIVVKSGQHASTVTTTSVRSLVHGLHVQST